ncbi:MAG: hypothetical protein J5691_01565 [Bacilli bacterium]|nr:hypothetical protein [Bacilli bacterium]
MSLRFASQLAIDNLPDEQLTDQFEVIMPALDISGTDAANLSFLGLDLYSYRPIVEEITFGQMNFSTEPRRIRTGWYHVPKDIESYHDCKMNFFCSANMTAQYYMDAWRALIFNKEGEYYYPGNHYKKNIDIFVYGPGGTGGIGNALARVGVNMDQITPRCHYTLQGCWPVGQDDYRLAYADDPKRFRLTVTFKVDNIVRDTSTQRAAVRNEFITSPTSILDNALSSMISSSEYNVEETYGGGAASMNYLKNKFNI